MLKKITLEFKSEKRCVVNIDDDGKIVSQQNEGECTQEELAMIALANALDFDPTKVLNFKCLK